MWKSTNFKLIIIIIIIIIILTESTTIDNFLTTNTAETTRIATIMKRSKKNSKHLVAGLELHQASTQ